MRLNRIQIRRLVESILNEGAAPIFDLTKEKLKKIPLGRVRDQENVSQEREIGTVSQSQIVTHFENRFFEDMAQPNAIVKHNIKPEGPSIYLFICANRTFYARINDTYGNSPSKLRDNNLESQSIDACLYNLYSKEFIELFPQYNVSSYYNQYINDHQYIIDHFSDNNKFGQMLLIKLDYGTPTSGAGDIPLEIIFSSNNEPDGSQVRELFKIGVLDVGSGGIVF